MARIARLHSWFVIIHTSLKIVVNEPMDTTELSARKPYLSALRRNVTLKNATLTMEDGPYA
jgi:hypothetical protein